MPKYAIWTHIDTGLEQIIEAENEEQALEIAEQNLSKGLPDDADAQILLNAQNDHSMVIRKEE